MMRVSLYKHELEIILSLTVQLTRMRQEECSHLATENIGPEIFGKLVDVLYSRGNYKTFNDAALDFGKIHHERST